jgi:hypothetical protein
LFFDRRLGGRLYLADRAFDFRHGLNSVPATFRWKVC